MYRKHKQYPTAQQPPYTPDPHKSKQFRLALQRDYINIPKLKTGVLQTIQLTPQQRQQVIAAIDLKQIEAAIDRPDLNLIQLHNSLTGLNYHPAGGH